ncbi:unnamed protein product [Musa acuminata var. zebrina]
MPPTPCVIYTLIHVGLIHISRMCFSCSYLITINLILKVMLQSKKAIM